MKNILMTDSQSHTNPSSLNSKILESAPLGKASSYINTYTPTLLFPLPRHIKRTEIGITEQLPFTGVDIWNAYEVSWLNSKGKPIVAMAEFWIPCESFNIVESKSFKLYLNSFNNSRFDSFEQVQSVLEADLSKNVEMPVTVKLRRAEESEFSSGKFQGQCIDDLEIECSEFMPNPTFLSLDPDGSDELIEETIHSHLLKSNCLVTGQPDWGSIEISYHGLRMSHEGLLKYIVSLRDHNEFHEQCVERIFSDIMRTCQPTWLSVYARYTRRGGLDINPYRVTAGSKVTPQNLRMNRQ